MATDEEIKKIIEGTLDERKKRTVGKVFRDPVKAEAIAYIFAMLFVVTLGGLIIFAIIPHTSFGPYYGDSDSKQFEKLILDKSDCKTLKSLLHEINQKSNSVGYTYLSSDIVNEITSRC